ncbi:ECF transporter S component [Clostridium bovifaecis]|uniref:ECF transporter S component n=1 Tax=Clostridium bovifaecis TaxID=2184719 RepID=A0A6I6EPY9_9CLOT|nr:ECF transporter S component [Clostridium bovifaecis]
MKKASLILTVLILGILMFIGYKYEDSENLGAIVTLAVLLILFLNYIYFEKSSMGAKEIALIATLSAFSAVCRVPFSLIPSVQPTTFLVALSGLVFGSYQGFLIGSTAAFISNIFLGQGPWTPWQMFAWGTIGAISGILGKNDRKISSEVFGVICFFYGILFGWITNLWVILSAFKAISIGTIISTNLTSLTVDIMHAGGNFIFVIVFYDKFYKILTRFKKRLKATYIND